MHLRDYFLYLLHLTLVMVDQIESQISTPPSRRLVTPRSQDSFFTRLTPLGLEKKIAAIAIILGTLPVFGVGAIGYGLANRALTQQLADTQQVSSVRLSDLISRYMAQRYADIQAIASSAVLANAKVRDSLSSTERDAALKRIVEPYGMYDDVAIFDLEGNVLSQTASQSVANQANQDYFRTVLKTNKPFISQPIIFSKERTSEVYFAAPIKDADTGKTIAIARADLPLAKLADQIKSYTLVGQEYRLLNNSSEVFLASQSDRIGRNAMSDFPELREGQRDPNRYFSEPGNRLFFSYAPWTKLDGLPDLNWQILLGSTVETASQPRQQLLLILGIGTSVAAVLAGCIAAWLSGRLARRLTSVTTAIQALGQGQLETRLTLRGDDEITSLSGSVNSMADQLQSLLQQQVRHASDLQCFNEATFHIRKSLDVDGVMQTAVREVRRLLECDRALVYLFDEQWQGTIVAESVALGYPASLGVNIADPCFAQQFVDKYRQGRMHSISNLDTVDIDPCYRGQLEPFHVKANLVAPMVVEGKLIGLLAVHQCSGPRDWQSSEMNLFYQMAVHVGFALEQVRLVEQEQKLLHVETLSEERRQHKETFQFQLLELLQHVEKAAMGDLTARAMVGEGEIGIIADFFNAIVENLQHLVQQVKQATVEVSASLGNHEVAVRSLSTDADLQAQETASTLASVEQMITSIKTVAQSAQQAAIVSQSASATAETGGLAIDATVQSIVELRQTIGETAKKVKRLGEASQQISKVVSLINQISVQTNMLAINAGIEAARAGKEGQGFATVADEVAALAVRASEATQEIEHLVLNIQQETGEVIDAMEQGTAQVVEGTQCVEDAKQSLEQMMKASHGINQLVQSISLATESQVETTHAIATLMHEIAQVAERTSNSSIQVSDSLRQTTAIAKELQGSVETFKVS